MEQLSVAGNLNTLGTGEYSLQVLRAYQPVTVGNGYYPSIIYRGDVPTGYTDDGRIYLIAAGMLGFFH